MDDIIPPDNDDDVRGGIKEEPEDQSMRNEDDPDYLDWLINEEDFMDHHLEFFLGLGDNDNDGPTWP